MSKTDKILTVALTPILTPMLTYMAICILTDMLTGMLTNTTNTPNPVTTAELSSDLAPATHIPHHRRPIGKICETPISESR